MFKIIRNSNWLTGGLIFFMPVLLIFFLASQMAYSQVNRQFTTYKNIPAVTTLTELERMPAEQVVMLRGQISALTAVPTADSPTDLLVYQERPAEDRDARYQEEFPVVFPVIIMDVAAGQVLIQPSLTRERVIQNELHRTQAGDRDYTGFYSGDTVMVQGQWEPNLATGPQLSDVTGITSLDKAQMLLDWQTRFQFVRWARNGLGLLTLLSLILLIVEIRRQKQQRLREESETWPAPQTMTKPTI